MEDTEFAKEFGRLISVDLLGIPREQLEFMDKVLERDVMEIDSISGPRFDIWGPM